MKIQFSDKDTQDLAKCYSDDDKVDYNRLMSEVKGQSSPLEQQPIETRKLYSGVLKRMKIDKSEDKLIRSFYSRDNNKVGHLKPSEIKGAFT